MSTRSQSTTATTAGRERAKPQRLAAARNVKAAQAEIRAAAQAAREARRTAAAKGEGVWLPEIPKAQRSPERVGATLDRIEAQMPRGTSARARERIVLVDARGDVIVDRYGVGDRTPELTPAEARLTARATMTHNHPNGSPPSADDARLASGGKMASVRAVMPRYIYEVAPGPRGWSKNTWSKTIGPAIYRALHENPAHQAMVRTRHADILSGRVSMKQANLDAKASAARNMDAVWRQVARETNGAIVYRRIPRAPKA